MGKGKLLLALAGLVALDRWDRNRRAEASWVATGGGTAIVTGASSGIGESFARQLGAFGYNLILVARRGERLEELARELRTRWNARVDVLVADLASEEGMAVLAQRIEATQDLDLLINNAGFGSGGPFRKGEMERQVDMIELHVEATTRLTRAALPGMIERGRGGIINVASTAGFMPLPGSVVYAATKSYIISFCEALQIELTGTGVRIQALCPGLTHSEFHDQLDGARFDRGRLPDFVWMTADEVAAASIQGLREEKVVVLPGLLNQLAAWVGRLGLVGLAGRFLEYVPEEQRRALPF